MNENIIAKTIINSVPNWYLSSIGPHVYSIDFLKTNVHFSSHRPLTPTLNNLKNFVNCHAIEWANGLPLIPSPTTLSKITESIALNWLNSASSLVNWDRVIAYLEYLKFRTYENTNVTINLVISPGEGSQSVFDESLQKILDSIATSQHVFIKVDYELRFIGYDQILWSQIKDTDAYKFNPEFLQPFASMLTADSFSVHLTNRGDIIILSVDGLLASCRKGKWYVYDVRTLKNSFTDIFNDYRVGCNLFEIIFDLSYKRHGALLVYDPANLVLTNLVNKESIIACGSTCQDAARAMLKDSINTIALGNSKHINLKKMLILEIASIDGAIIFNKNEITAFGAMIKSHPNSGNCFGARTTAAVSALNFGGFPIKISSDGDVTIYFYDNFNGEKVYTSLNFM